MTRQIIWQPTFSLRLRLSLIALSLLASLAVHAQTLRSRVTYPRSDVTIETVAVTFPNDEKTKIGMLGTDRFNNLKGSAVVERDKGKAVSLIKIDIGRLPHPSQVCQACGTYIVWAVTPICLASSSALSMPASRSRV